MVAGNKPCNLTYYSKQDVGTSVDWPIHHYSNKQIMESNFKFLALVQHWGSFQEQSLILLKFGLQLLIVIFWLSQTLLGPFMNGC
jgi:hypothetical protein